MAAAARETVTGCNGRAVQRQLPSALSCCGGDRHLGGADLLMSVGEKNNVAAESLEANGAARIREQARKY
jgi:hypothetical protein